MSGRRVAMLAAWLAVAFAIQWGQAAPRAHEALLALRGPVHADAAFLAHWFVMAVSAAKVAAFWLAALALGSVLLRWTGIPAGVVAAERRPATWLFGFGLYGCLTVGFGLCGLLYLSRAAVVLTLLALLGLREVRGMRGRTARATEGAGVAWVRRAAIACMALVAVMSMTPETWIDSLSYHLTAPQDFNDLHKLVDIGQDTYRYPLLAEGIYGQGMLLGGEPVALLLNLSGALLTACLLWGWAARLAGPAAGWLAVLALVASDQVAFHMAQANQGMFSTGFSFLGVWAWMHAPGGTGARRWKLLAGIALGWAVCAKYTAAAPALGIAAWHLVRLPRAPRREGAGLAWMAVAGAAAAAPFLANGWLFTGNPVYPLFFGGLGWGEGNERIMRLFGCVGYDFGFGNAAGFVKSLFRLLIEEQPLLLVALPAVFPLVARPEWRPFVWAWGGAFIAWSIGVPCLRLMMPMFPAIALVSAVAVIPWFSGGRAARAVAAAGTAGVLALGVVESVGAADMHKRSLAAALGLEPREAYLSRILTTYHEAVREVNARVPSSARVLMIGDIRGYRFAPLVLNRDVEDTPAMYKLAREARAPGEIAKRIRQTGARWVVLNHVTSGYLAHYWNQAFVWRTDEVRRAWEFWRRWGEAEWMSPEPDGVNGGYVLYRVRPRPGPPAAVMPFLPGAEPAAARGMAEGWEAYYRRMVILDRAAPGVAYFGTRLATAQVKTARFREALPVIAAALACGHVEPGVLHGLRAVALQKLGDIDGALAEFRRAEEIRPDDLSIRGLREECEREARAPESPEGL